MRIVQSSAKSDVGRKRRHNEDSYVSAPPMFAVADGMGGAQAGEVASGLAADTVQQENHDPNVSGEERVVALIKAANLRVHERAASDAAASGMGTTMTVAVLQADGSIAIGHVGDSRAYRLRDGRLEQLTDDHSLVGELVRRGELSLEEAAVHPQRSVITRALGTDADVDVDVYMVETKDGDVFLLCSDGLTTMVDVDTIATILERNRSNLDAGAAALIKAANDRGGDDNITAILFAVAEGEPASDEEPLPPRATGHDPDDEDTLHPEDNVRLPEIVDAPPSDVTMVVSAADLAKTLGASSATPEPLPVARPAEDPPPSAEHWATTEPLPAVTESEAAPAGEGPDDETTADHSPAAEEAGEAETTGGEREAAEKASLARLTVAFLVIAILVAAIVLLVLKALPR